MATKNYGELEQHIINIFSKESNFVFNGNTYRVTIVGKPRPSGMGGECKTDVYVLGTTANHSNIELKISVKTESTNEFQGNKLTSDVMEAYLGEGWEDIVQESAMSIHHKFMKRPLIDVSGHHPVQPNSITLGWKLEIADKERGLSSLLPLTDREIRDYVYKGINQSTDKINSNVNGRVIQNSGIADFILKTEVHRLNSTKDVIQQMEHIDFAKLKPTYFIFTANNYRTDVDKADGPRSLAVYINWKFINNRLSPELVYSEPLKYTGQNDIKPLLIQSLKKLGKFHPYEMDFATDIDPWVVVNR